MIVRDVLQAMRLRTCAIGVLKTTMEEFVKHPSLPQFKIFGTGFLIAPLTVLTNRHVLASIAAFIANESLPKERRYVSFLRPETSGVAQTYHEIEKMGMIIEPKSVDVGLVSFRATQEDPIRTLSPVAVPSYFSGEVGEPIAVYGYAFGENLLKREYGEHERTYRFGPILQHGYISAISPFEHAPAADRLLLDVRTARGMSGSPVFHPTTGSVLAVHSSGMEDTVAFAIPISSQFISECLAIHPLGSPGDTREGTASWVRTSPPPS